MFLFRPMSNKITESIFGNMCDWNLRPWGKKGQAFAFWEPWQMRGRLTFSQSQASYCCSFSLHVSWRKKQGKISSACGGSTWQPEYIVAVGAEEPGAVSKHSYCEIIFGCGSNYKASFDFRTLSSLNHPSGFLSYPLSVYEGYFLLKMSKSFSILCLQES